MAGASESVLDDLAAGEPALTPKEAAEHPLIGGVDQATMYRYFERGLYGHKLEFAQLPAGRVTSASALRRWCEKLTAAAQGRPHGPSTRSPRRRQSALDATRKRLAKIGM
jgi:hypothetical protein